MSLSPNLEMGEYQDLPGRMALVFWCQCGHAGELADSQLLATTVGVFAECEKCGADFEVDLN